MKKVAIIGTAGVPGRYGGFETLAHHLVLQLNHSYALTVYNSKKTYPKGQRPASWEGAKLIYLPFSANGFQSIIYDAISIIHALFFADILIVLGVSGGIFMPLVRLFRNKKVIVNIDGLEWRRDKWSKPIKAFLHFSEKMAVRFSNATITDNAGIKRYTGRYYKTTSIQIEYGADHVIHKKLGNDTLKRFPFLKNDYAFCLARIEPENNTHLILDAFSRLPEKQLVFIGNWDISPYGKNLKEKYSRFENIHILDPIYEQEPLDEIRSNCKIYIHGHSAGGTNPSLVEAMRLKLPVFSFDVSFNRATTQEQAIFFKDADDLILKIRNTDDPMLETVANKLEKIARKRYTWALIASKYHHAIQAFEYNYRKKPLRGWISTLPQQQLISLGLTHLAHQKYFYE